MSSNSSSTIPTGETGPYRLQIAGPKTTFEVKVTSEGLFGRVDMPGVDQDGEVIVFADVDNSMLVFDGAARAEQERMRYQSPRSYKGGIRYPFVFDIPRRVRALMKNGVLRFFVPAVSSYETVAAPLVFGLLPLPLPSAEEENRDRNPFQVGGPKLAMEQLITGHDKIVFRVDLPGVAVVNWKNLHIPDQTWKEFECNAVRGFPVEENPGRMYAGRIDLNCECCTVRSVESEMFNGVLIVVVSKIKKEL